MSNVSTAHPQSFSRFRPLLTLLVPLALLPLVSCAQDTYLAQNYQTVSPTAGQPDYNTPPPSYANVPQSGQFLAPPQLSELVARIALYPDDLIGIILPASTYPLQVVQAARYLDAVRSNSTLAPDDSWDNSVVALLNYPDVVNMMDRELEWTERLGQAVIMQQADVISAIGQFRAQAQAAGNLRSDERQLVEVQEGAIRIRPANPQVIYVPQYEPTRVIVYQSEPFRYYPRPCPVYYYNYSSGYPSGFSNFWGVSTMFTIGWSTRRVHLHDYDYYDDPRFDRPYNGYFYRRSRHDWHDDDDHRGRDGDRYEGRDGRDGRGDYGPRPPRERDWQPRGGNRPRPMGVGNGGRNQGDRDNDGHGAGRGAGRDNGKDAPRPRGGQSAFDNNGGRTAPTVVPPRSINSGGRSNISPSDPPQDARFSRPTPPRAAEPRRGDPPQDARFSRPVPARESAPQRGDPPADNRGNRPARSVEPRRVDPPQDARFSRPMPARDNGNDARRVAPPTSIGPPRPQRNVDDSRGNSRTRDVERQVSPSRDAVRNVGPSRSMQVAPPAREAPNRASGGGGRGNSRGNDDDRGRGNRDR